MTRKHFVAIADALARSEASRETVQAVASELARFNPNFDRARFVDAAGVGVSV